MDKVGCYNICIFIRLYVWIGIEVADMVNTTFNTAERILEVLKQENKVFTPYELSIKTGMAFKTVVDCMQKLEEWGKVEIITNGRTRLIKLKKEDDLNVIYNEINNINSAVEELRAEKRR